MSRCVHCGAAKEKHHGPGLVCLGSSGKEHVFGSLDLPNGLTCGDCVHIPRCEAIFGHIPSDTYCDWWPIRFRAKEGHDDAANRPPEVGS